MKKIKKNIQKKVQWFGKIAIAASLLLGITTAPSISQVYATTSQKQQKEVGTFINGKLITSANSISTDSGRYVPFDVIKSIPNITVTSLPSGSISIKGSKGIIIVNDKAKFASDNTIAPMITVNNKKYILNNSLQKISNYSFKVLPNSGSLVLWTNEEGKKESDRLYNTQGSFTQDIAENLGKKVYFYDDNYQYEYGWISDLKVNKTDYIEKSTVSFILKNGTKKDIQLSYMWNDISIISNDNFKEHQKLVGLSLWINLNDGYHNFNKNFKHTEKVKVNKVKLTKTGGYIVSLLRNNGQVLDEDFGIQDITGRFFTTDPKAGKKWSSEVWKNIEGQYVWMGATPEQMRLSWGNPDHINRTVTKYGTHEQWVYDGSYVYFDDGKVTSWQN